MISEKTYYELLLFKDGPIGLDGRLSKRLEYIIEQGLIEAATRRTEHPYENEWVIEVESWKLSEKGSDSLAEFEKDRQNEAETESKEKRANHFQLLNTVLGAFLGALFGVWLGSRFG